ncbi:hypothetical protein ABIF78_007766 [Bradyrhizobium japonicum]
MGTSEQNYERLCAMRQENEQRREELAAAQRERENDPLAEAMRQPLVDPLAKWRCEQQQGAPPARQRRLDTSPVNWSAVDQRIGGMRKYLLEVITGTIAELAERQRDAIDDAMRPLRVELAELRISNCEVRAANAELCEQLAAGHVTDLPPLPLRGSRTH